MKDFFEKQRLTKEEAEKEAEQIRNIVGPEGSKKDYEDANEYIEKTKSRDPDLRWESLQKERITIIPPHGDHYTMIGLMTDDPKVYQLFNAAAASVTHKKYGGFHQVGSNDKTGYTAWEIWKPGDTPFTQIVNEIYAEMPRMKDLYYPEEKK